MYASKQSLRLRLGASTLSPCSRRRVPLRWLSEQKSASLDEYSSAIEAREPHDDSGEIVLRKETPYVRRSILPSPFADPAFSKKRPSKAPKPSYENLTLLQRQLAKNPYAQALASDVRYCSVTNARLPKFFLQDFELLEHPEDGSPHYVPRSLTKGAKPGVLNAPPTFPTKDEKAEPQETISRKGYILARRIMIEFMTSTGRGTKPWFSWAFDLSRWISLQKLKMRYDMHDLVLFLMRKRIVEEIIWMYAMRHRGVIYMTPCKNEDWVEEVRSKKTQLGAVLWLGKNGDVEGSTSNVPGDFATLDMDKARGTKLPVHNLVRLLGPENISYLRDKAPTLFGKATAVTLKYKTTTSGLLSKLWKLEGYTALEAEYQAYKIAEEEEEK